MSSEASEVEKTLVNFRIEETQKQKWGEHVEESDVCTTLTQLIRSSVEAEIAGNHDTGSTESPALSSDVQTISDDVERIKKDVHWLRNQEQDSADISDTALELFDELASLKTSVRRRFNTARINSSQLSRSS